MSDGLRYAGRRVIVTGAATGPGAAVARILVDLGAEVHAVDRAEPKVGGLASVTRCDLREPAEARAAATRIGSIVNGLFLGVLPTAGAPDPGGLLLDLAAARGWIDAVVPHMIEGAAVALLAAPVAAGADPGVDPVAAYVAHEADELAGAGIRINCVVPEVDRPGATPSADDCAWPLVFLNSPRAAAVTGQRLTVGGGPPASRAAHRTDPRAMTPERVG